jgi:rfaE bifunctional protein nucleotidyltransferase chain/domain
MKSASADNRSSPLQSARILSWDELIALRAEWKRKGWKVVFTNGVFDLLHRGHVEYLKAARALGDVLVVGVNTDASVKKFKDARRPIVSEQDRALILSSLRFVDAVTLFDQPTPLELITKLQPDLLVKGADYGKNEIVGVDVVEKAGGRVVRIALTEGKSTSNLIEEILRRYKPA